MIDPAILYWGTPVVLLSTVSATGEVNLAPVSGVFWLGNRAVMGVSTRSQTARVGYRHVGDRFAAAGLDPVDSDLVRPPRAGQCPVAMEGRVVSAHALEGASIEDDGASGVFEVEVLRTHVEPRLRVTGFPNRIDPQLWRPLIMSFQRFFALGDEVHPSRLSHIDEEWYR